MNGIYYKTSLKKFLDNCNECEEWYCPLPYRHNRNGNVTDTLRKKYLNRRHENCPLIEVEEVKEGNVRIHLP